MARNYPQFSFFGAEIGFFAAEQSSKSADFRFRCLNEGVICALMMEFALLYK